LERLTKRYNIVHLGQLAESISSRRRQPSRLAAITIDDCYRDAYEIAYPPLRSFGAPSTLFVPTDFNDRRGWIWTDKARFLARTGSADRRRHTTSTISHRGAPPAERANAALKRLPEEIKEKAIERLARAASVEAPPKPPDKFGPSHWRSAGNASERDRDWLAHPAHPILTRVRDERWRLELQESKSRLEEVLKRRIEQFCYPNGNYDEQARSEVARAGYKVAETCVSGLNKRGSDRCRSAGFMQNATAPILLSVVQSVSGF
jgi:peptidoglycan/xylan/chitin deacetylase (PgdA/CDA1 family)